MATSMAAAKRVVIRHENGQRNVYKAGVYLASIFDHRRSTGASIQGNWGVAWSTGRYDWHETYGQARDNVLKA